MPATELDLQSKIDPLLLEVADVVNTTLDLDTTLRRVAELVRKDKRFEELKLKADDYVTKEAVISVLLEHPELMQRPVVIRGARAVIARPPEKLAGLL